MVAAGAGVYSVPEAERYQRSAKALVLALQEICLQGVATRKVKGITEPLCVSESSKDRVSALDQALDEELERWRKGPLRKRYPYLVCDARYEHIREDGRVARRGDAQNASPLRPRGPRGTVVLSLPELSA
jgi:transposase-like protein